VTRLSALPAREAIDAVVFDAGGVLMLPDAEACRAAVRALDCESHREDWQRAHYAANLLLDQMDTPDWPSVRRAIAAEAGVPDDQLDAASALIEEVIAGTPWVPVDGAANVLRELSDAGYQLAVVSNATGTVAQQLEQHGICSVTGGAMPRVEVVIDSHLVGIEKPDPRIFHLALETLAAEPARCLYVGDTVKFDVLGARAAGLHPVHVDPFSLCDGTHSHISALAELADWLV
jgi:putative hydrolase of the HAD superfamily